MIRTLLITALVALTALPMLAADLPNIDKLWDWDNASLSEQRFRDALPEARKSGNTDYLAELLTQLARSQGRQKRFDEANKTLDEANKLLKRGPSRPRVRCLLERGRVLNTSGHPDESRPFFVQAWETANQAKEEALALDAAHMLGIVETPDKALEWNHKAIALAEASKSREVRGWLGPLYNNTGWTYYDRGDYPKALDLLTKAQAVYIERGTPTQIRIAKYSVGKTLRALGKVEEALAIQEKLEAELKATGTEQDGYIDEEMGECLLLLKREVEAKPYFAKAYAALSKDDELAKNEPKRLERLKTLGGL